MERPKEMKKSPETLDTPVFKLRVRLPTAERRDQEDEDKGEKDSIKDSISSKCPHR